MDRSEYDEKMDRILNDPTKFQKLEEDPTEELKKKINKLVNKANARQNEVKFPKVIGDYSPGYCYGTVKTHKPGNPLRPIISQMTSPTYKVAKILNELLVPYVPKGYALRSATEFLDLLKSNPTNEDIASLDAESLFTNVPVDETINIIIEKVYHSNMTPLPFTENTLKDLLQACTKEAPFISHKGDLYRQTDGVAMGSPLGVLFANMYMASVEEKTFERHTKPTIYSRYIDDIFVTIKDNNHLQQLKEAFQQNSVLRFTTEESQNQKIPFLDILVKKEGNNFNTTVYTKQTNVGRCLNARGECPDAYKKSVVNSYVNRAFTHCSTWRQTHNELDRIRQLLTNNGYKEDMVEECIRRKMDKFASSEEIPTDENNSVIPIYYKMNFGTAYNQEAKVVQGIIRRGLSPTDENTKIDLRIYCRPNLMSSLVMKNSTAPPKEKSLKTNVVYKFTCPEGNCESPTTTYIGHTTTHLRRRLQNHRNNGAIFQHYTDKHNRKPGVEELLQSTVIIGQESNIKRLMIAEAVSIKLQKPNLNIQMASQYILPSSRRQRVQN